MVSPRYIGAYMAYYDTHDLLEVLAEVGVVDLDGGGSSLGHDGECGWYSGGSMGLTRSLQGKRAVAIWGSTRRTVGMGTSSQAI